MFNKEGGKSIFDGFVRIEGISGESSDEKHAGWIEIIDFDMNVSQTVAPIRIVKTMLWKFLK